MSVVMDFGIRVVGGACESKLKVSDHLGRDGAHNIWLFLYVSYAIMV